MTLTEIFKALVPVVSGSSLLTVAILLYLFSHPEKIDAWGRLLFLVLSKTIGGVSSLRRGIDRGLIAWDIGAAVNATGEIIARQAPGVIPYSLRIEWVKESTVEAFLQRGEVVVRLNPHSNQERNLVIASYAYASRALLPKARQYMDSTLREASILGVVRMILGRKRTEGTYAYFHEHHLKPVMSQDRSLEKDLTLLDELESVGLLTRVFFREVRDLGERLFPNLPTQRDAQEIRALANFLYELAAKEPGKDVPLRFVGPRVKIAMVLVAKRGKLLAAGAAPYLRAIERSVLDGSDPIFVTGWGTEHVYAVRSIAQEARRRGMIEELRTAEFPMSRHKELMGKGIIVASRSSRKFQAEAKILTEPIRAALIKHVPEMRSGQVEIVGIARSPGFGSKVSVRIPEDEQAGRRAVQMCLGPNASRLESIRKELPGKEWIRVVPWSPDIEEFLLATVFRDQADRACVVELKVDEDNFLATVYVNDREAAAKIIGREGREVKLAARLVGLEIQVEVAI
jgi:transcription antitermination factor NusA-like protein